jgi:hypothetical protein
MYSRDAILEAASAIRPYLSTLLGADATTIDDQVASLIARGQSGEGIENLLLDLLVENDATRVWIEAFLRERRPPDAYRTYNPLLGKLSSVNIPKYACPYRDYIWFRRSVELPVPQCPTHGLTLTLVNED